MKPAVLTAADINRYGECVCFNLRWFSRAVTQYYERRLGGAGLRYTQTPILARLAAAPAKMAELSRWLALERSALLRTLQPLIDEGYVLSRPARTGRGVELSVTASGRQLLAELRPEWEKVQAEVVAALGVTRWKDFLGAMETAADRLEKN